jgi:hypothetical protein
MELRFRSGEPPIGTHWQREHRLLPALMISAEDHMKSGGCLEQLLRKLIRFFAGFRIRQAGAHDPALESYIRVGEALGGFGADGSGAGGMATLQHPGADAELAGGKSRVGKSFYRDGSGSGSSLAGHARREIPLRPCATGAPSSAAGREQIVPGRARIRFARGRNGFTGGQNDFAGTQNGFADGRVVPGGGRMVLRPRGGIPDIRSGGQRSRPQ